MAKLRIRVMDDAVIVQGRAAGDVETRAYHGSDDPLQLYLHRIGPGAALRMQAGMAEQIGYVWKGSVSAGVVVLEEGASLITEFGTHMDVTAGADGATLLVFTPRERSADARAGGHVHLLPRARVPCKHDLGTQNMMGGGLHADAACPTCKLWLHENDFHNPNGTPVPPHSHSEDEIIFITKGEMQFGTRALGPGTALAIDADSRYSFQAAHGLSFVNFRAASPTVTASRVTNEAEMWLARVGRPPYLEASAN